MVKMVLLVLACCLTLAHRALRPLAVVPAEVQLHAERAACFATVEPFVSVALRKVQVQRRALEKERANRRVCARYV